MSLLTPHELKKNDTHELKKNEWPAARKKLRLYRALQQRDTFQDREE